MLRSEWKAKLKPFTQVDLHKVRGQIINTVIPYGFFFTLGVYMVETRKSIWLIAPLMVLAALFMVRTFILFHDCTHGSFVKSTKNNTILGTIFGILSLTPYEPWKVEHQIHHGAVGNLGKRGTGDIWTMTFQEYIDAPWLTKVIYRIFRNPFFLFFIAPFFKFLIINRFPSKGYSLAEHKSIAMTNIGILAMSIIYIQLYSWQSYLLMLVVTGTMAGGLGIWLFYIQHQFEEVYWEEDGQWDSIDAALKGSTFYRLPLILEWFSGYIGYHHIHHLNARIPNYHLKPCYEGIEELKDCKTVNLMESFPLASLQLYDKENKRLVKFSQYKQQLLQKSLQL